MKSLVVAILVALVAGSALAVAPTTESFVGSVARGQGQCPGGICSQWRTSAWIYNPGTSTAHVRIFFLVRGNANPSAAYQDVVVAAGETKEYMDVFQSPFNLDGVYGGLRFTSDVPVEVTARTFDANVVTNKGTGTAGQFVGATPASQAIGSGGSTDIIGLAQDGAGVWRSNWGMVETTGSSVNVTATVTDNAGNTIGTKTYSLGGYGATQVGLDDIGAPAGLNRRVRLSVTGGSGKIVAFASRIDNATGDPFTVEMRTSLGGARTTGIFEGIVLTPDGTKVDGGARFQLSASAIQSLFFATGIPCGTDSVVVDYDTTTPVTINSNGTFTVTTQGVTYNDITGPAAFNVVWTLSGTLSNGVLSGQLTSVTSGGATVGGYPYGTCNGTAVRNWRAGWTADSL